MEDERIIMEEIDSDRNQPTDQSGSIRKPKSTKEVQ